MKYFYLSGWNFSVDQRKSFIKCGKCTNSDCRYGDCLATINNSVFCSFQSSDVSTVTLSSENTRYTTEHETRNISKKDPFINDTIQHTGKCLIQRLKSYSFDEMWNVH